MDQFRGGGEDWGGRLHVCASTPTREGKPTNILPEPPRLPANICSVRARMSHILEVQFEPPSHQRLCGNASMTLGGGHVFPEGVTTEVAQLW